MTNTLDVLKARASVKEYDTNAPISKEELTELLDLAAKAPSAWNLQHWHFTVFHSDESKAELLPVAYNQKQIVESSAVVAILGDLKANENGEEVYAELASQGYITDEIKQTLLGQINGAYQSEQFARDSAFLNASLGAVTTYDYRKSKRL